MFCSFFQKAGSRKSRIIAELNRSKGFFLQTSVFRNTYLWNILKWYIKFHKLPYILFELCFFFCLIKLTKFYEVYSSISFWAYGHSVIKEFHYEIIKILLYSSYIFLQNLKCSYDILSFQRLPPQKGAEPFSNLAYNVSLILTTEMMNKIYFWMKAQKW